MVQHISQGIPVGVISCKIVASPVCLCLMESFGHVLTQLDSFLTHIVT